MKYRVRLSVVELPEVRRAYSAWRHSLGTDPERRREYERSFLKMFIDRVASELGRETEAHFDEEITSGTVFEGVVRRSGKQVTITVTITVTGIKR